MNEKRAAPRKQCALTNGPPGDPPLHDMFEPEAAGTSAFLDTLLTSVYLIVASVSNRLGR